MRQRKRRGIVAVSVSVVLFVLPACAPVAAAAPGAEETQEGTSGYMQRQMNLGGMKCAGLPVDGNADGCFNTVGQDRVRIEVECGTLDQAARSIEHLRKVAA